MTPIIERIDFIKNLIVIPYINIIDIDKDNFTPIIDSYIEDKGNEFLRITLGINLFNQLKQAVNDASGDRNLLDDKFKELLLGVDSDNTFFEGVIKGSVNYIAFYYLSSLEHSSGANGVVFTKQSADGVKPNLASYYSKYLNTAHGNSKHTFSFLHKEMDIYKNTETGKSDYLFSGIIPTRSIYNF